MNKALIVFLLIFFNWKCFSHCLSTSIKDEINSSIEYVSSGTLSNTDSVIDTDLVYGSDLKYNDSSSSIAVESVQRDYIRKLLREVVSEEFKDTKLNNTIRDSIESKIGHPVLGINNDTLFYIYTKLGSSLPKDRAFNISQRLKRIFDEEFLRVDSIKYMDAEFTVDIVYGEVIIMSVSESDAKYLEVNKIELARNYTDLIRNDLIRSREDISLYKIAIRAGLLLLIVIGVLIILWLINRGFIRLKDYILMNKNTWLKSLTYKDYTYLTAEQEIKVIVTILIAIKWFINILILYIALPIVFSVFPFTRGYATVFFNFFWDPFKSIIVSVWEYLPNLFTIIVIYFVMRNVLKIIRYIFKEIESEKLKIAGFHSDLAMPTNGIIRFLLYAFMFVLIFPYLPGSDSNIFKGVSVFLGILFSFGSSSAISNMVAGIVITYMRPFKIGDRIRIGEVFGDVEEKNLLVTRIKTLKNEIITIPNSSVLSSNTINYSIEINNVGLILHTTVTIGYDVSWKDMHQALIDAALRTESIVRNPEPFVLQTSLDDFYVSYQINAYTKEVKQQAIIYSNLHQNIQDVCNERGIEILSPHYRAARDGNMTTIPEQYLKSDYVPPSFTISIKQSSNDSTN